MFWLGFGIGVLLVLIAAVVVVNRHLKDLR